MSMITVIVIMYGYTLLASFLLTCIVAWSYKIKEKNFLIQIAFKLFVALYILLSPYVFLFISKKAESQDEGDIHSIICLIIYMFVFVHALAKYDPRAHEKISFRFKKKDK